MNQASEQNNIGKYLLILGGCTLLILFYLSLCSGISKSETQSYILKVNGIHEEAKARAETKWTNLGSFSAMQEGFYAILAHEHHEKVDPVVVAKYHHWAKCGIDLYEEMDGEAASFFKGALVGAALTLDFSGVTWGGSSLGAYGILDADASDEKHAEKRFVDASNELYQYLLEKEYLD